MIINVHAGHSLKCRGASGLLDEVNEDRAVKNRVIELLRANGHTVYDCTDDVGKTQNANLRNIVRKCNDHKVDLDVSIHLNAGGGTGTEVYIYSDSSKAKDEATRIAEKISNALGIRNRCVKTSTKLYVLKKTKSPALLVECCFVDNAIDKVKWNADKCAKAIVEGILNKSVNEHPTPKPQSNTSNALGTYMITASDLKVRTGPGMKYRVKTHNELTKDAKAHDYDRDGCINYGTRVTVSKFDGDWAKIPSGWVAKRCLKKV
ncbi:N-acetylmuramoyl-L-alanine amidase [Catenibacterium sp.]|uniref:N-acetylmuramoyl-L-alanine amidase n=1 Tax=Catenibacterium sp. TaxID=2049022 RepID=UPI0040254C39